MCDHHRNLGVSYMEPIPTRDAGVAVLDTPPKKARKKNRVSSVVNRIKDSILPPKKKGEIRPEDFKGTALTTKDFDSLLDSTPERIKEDPNDKIKRILDSNMKHGKKAMEVIYIIEKAPNKDEIIEKLVTDMRKGVLPSNKALLKKYGKNNAEVVSETPVQEIRNLVKDTTVTSKKIPDKVQESPNDKIRRILNSAMNEDTQAKKIIKIIQRTPDSQNFAEELASDMRAGILPQNEAVLARYGLTAKVEAPTPVINKITPKRRTELKSTASTPDTKRTERKPKSDSVTERWISRIESTADPTENRRLRTEFVSLMMSDRIPWDKELFDKYKDGAL